MTIQNAHPLTDIPVDARFPAIRSSVELQRFERNREVVTELEERFNPEKRDPRIQFGLDNALEPFVRLKIENGSSVDVRLLGANPTSFKASNELQNYEVTWVSKQSQRGGQLGVDPAQPVRGGLFFCTPNLGPSPGGMHGFGRLLEWNIASIEGAGSGIKIRFEVDNQDLANAKLGQDLQEWGDHKFKLVIEHTLQPSGLTNTLGVYNQNESGSLFLKPGVHNYFNASGDVSLMEVIGNQLLRGDTQWSQGIGMSNPLRQGQPAEISGVGVEGPVSIFSNPAGRPAEIDRVYLEAGRLPYQVMNTKAGMGITIRTVKLPDVRIWNPGPAKAEAMLDYGNDEYREHLCVEPLSDEAVEVEAQRSTVFGQSFEVFSIPEDYYGKRFPEYQVDQAG